MLQYIFQLLASFDFYIGLYRERVIEKKAWDTMFELFAPPAPPDRTSPLRVALGAGGKQIMATSSFFYLAKQAARSATLLSAGALNTQKLKKEERWRTTA